MSILDALTEYACSPDVIVVNLITVWQPTPIFLQGESHGQRSLVGYSPRSHKESDMTKWLSSLNRQLTITNHINKPWHDAGKLISASYISCSDAEASHSTVTVPVPCQAWLRHLLRGRTSHMGLLACPELSEPLSALVRLVRMIAIRLSSAQLPCVEVGQVIIVCWGLGELVNWQRN